MFGNEDVSASIIDGLRRSGHDVSSVRETLPSVSDSVILDYAVAEKRIVVTDDKDFGEFAFRFGLPAECGIILCRFPGDRATTNSVILDAIKGRSDWAGNFAVIEPGRVRMRPLP